LLTLPGVDDVVIAADVGVTLDNPHKFLARVVEVQLDLVGRRVDGFSTSELEGLNEVLVGDLGELTTLISVQVDVVYVERSSDQVGGVDTITDGVNVGELRGDVPHEVLEVVELEVDTDFVVLERDQRESKTRVAAEPELERDVEGVLGGAAEELARGVGLTTSAVIVAILTALNDQVG
jgi:hypothetical protein